MSCRHEGARRPGKSLGDKKFSGVDPKEAYGPFPQKPPVTPTPPAFPGEACELGPKLSLEAKGFPVKKPKPGLGLARNFGVEPQEVTNTPKATEGPGRKPAQRTLPGEDASLPVPTEYPEPQGLPPTGHGPKREGREGELRRVPVDLQGDLKRR